MNHEEGPDRGPTTDPSPTPDPAGSADRRPLHVRAILVDPTGSRVLPPPRLGAVRAGWALLAEAVDYLAYYWARARCRVLGCRYAPLPWSPEEHCTRCWLPRPE